MCDIGSRIEGKNGKVWFVTSAEMKKHMRDNPKKIPADYGGHSGIKLIHPDADGNELEGFPVPKAMGTAINAGKLDELHRLAHNKYVRVDSKGQRHGAYKSWYSDGQLWMDCNYEHGQCH